jgi:hypothetical protein
MRIIKIVVGIICLLLAAAIAVMGFIAEIYIPMSR